MIIVDYTVMSLHVASPASLSPAVAVVEEPTHEVTFERVTSMPNARISILPLPAFNDHKQSSSAYGHGIVEHPQQQARLNIGKVRNLERVTGLKPHTLLTSPLML